MMLRIHDNDILIDRYPFALAVGQQIIAADGRTTTVPYTCVMHCAEHLRLALAEWRSDIAVIS